ncbi:hypothetical protein [Mesorhizobium sp.]|uniref:hypothetical protein n=1 Tax=Mesorhizobium sp. TaxID=1871066 RepID=UPI0025797CE5|nr:hypothetical protein [Mesorhizobium sp.]
MDPKDLSRAAADVAPGARETLNVWRNGKAMQISAAVGRNSDDAKTPSAEGNGGKSPRPRFLLPAGYLREHWPRSISTRSNGSCRW